MCDKGSPFRGVQCGEAALAPRFLGELVEIPLVIVENHANFSLTARYQAAR